MKPIWTLLTAALLFFLQGASAYSTTEPSNEEDWSVKCSSDLCEVYAEIRLDNGALINSIMFRKLDKDVYAAILKLPLGIHIPSGIQIGIDDDALFDAKLITCQPNGCEAAFNANKAIVNFLKRGKAMSIVVTKSSDRKKLALNYSLIGFTRSWDEFTKRMAVLLPDETSG
ncbi:invasion associated locus B family protein [Pseudovibrio sp. JE062]|uniref:invasion associated locus B family protein n=1 Tax=Pseudovibrio sp. JE062 TaxID=439495 RepID=UPI000186BB89|nr:invasion associated locus B family protein [Pseudovibrio sp. JE062]EEA94662.1 Invasion associated locus B protein [Pseudovibrio sp. JE062]